DAPDTVPGVEEEVAWVAEVQEQPAGLLVCTVSWPPEDWAAGPLRTLARHLRTLTSWRRPPPQYVTLRSAVVLPGCAETLVEGVLLERLAAELQGVWNGARLVLPETYLGTQLFFRAAGYRALCVWRGYYEDEDGYLMERARA